MNFIWRTNSADLPEVSEVRCPQSQRLEKRATGSTPHLSSTLSAEGAGPLVAIPLSHSLGLCMRHLEFSWEPPSHFGVIGYLVVMVMGNQDQNHWGLMEVRGNSVNTKVLPCAVAQEQGGRSWGEDKECVNVQCTRCTQDPMVVSRDWISKPASFRGRNNEAPVFRWQFSPILPGHGWCGLRSQCHQREVLESCSGLGKAALQILSEAWRSGVGDCQKHVDCAPWELQSIGLSKIGGGNGERSGKEWCLPWGEI